MSDSTPTRAEFATVRRVSAAEARVLVDRGEAVLVDTRDRRLFDNAHAADATPMPLAQITAAPGEARRLVPPDRTLIFYCT